MATTTTYSLAQMVDLALGSPELGAVNFNVLHTLLHAMLTKLDLGATQANVNESDHIALLDKKDVDIAAPKDSTAISDSEKGSIPVSQPSYHQMAAKISKLEKQMEVMNALPSNDELFDRLKSKGEGERPRPMADMWQSMQLTKRVDANEAGISKLMSLVEDLMGEMQTLKDEADRLRKQIADLHDMSKMDDLLAKLKDLENQMNDLDSRHNQLTDILGSYPTLDDLNAYVTWPGLQDALKGIKDSIAYQPPERIVVDMTSQTTPRAETPAKPGSTRPVSAISTASRTATPGPDPETLELLEKLGTLNSRHDSLEVRVDKLEADMPKKADKVDLDADKANLEELRNTVNSLQNQPSSGGPVDLPSDLVDQLRDMQDQIERLKKFRDKLSAANAVQPASSSDQTDSQPPPNMADIITESDKDEIYDKMRALERGQGDLQEKVGNLDKYNESLGSELKDIQKHMSVFMMTSCGGDGDDKDDLCQTVDLLQASLAEVEARMQSLQEFVMSHEIEDGSVMTDGNDVTAGFGSVCPSPDVTDSDATLQRKEAHTADEEMKRHVVDGAKLEKKVVWLMQDTNRQLAATQERLSGLERELNTLVKDSTRRDSLVSLHKAASSASVRDSDSLSRLQQVVLQLQAEVERINTATQQLLDDANNKQAQIDTLVNSVQDLDQKKADKELLHMEVEVKADKRQLETKVNRSAFDKATEELNQMIKDLLDKLFGHENEWKSALGTLTSDIDGKIDRLEFKPIRDDIESQLKALSRKLTSLDLLGDGGEDDAAGIRKQLLQRFNCISCDRPVDMLPQGPIPSIPASAGLPGTRSTRPYTTFELDQIRQAARSGTKRNNHCAFGQAVYQRQLARCKMHDCKLLRTIKLPPLPDSLAIPQRSSFRAHYRDYDNIVTPAFNQSLEVQDMYATARSCGGTHTTTFPHRRITRMTHIKN